MNVVVLGAGVIGVATAYFLRRHGHDVRVVERRPEPALETSFANAGLIVPSQSFPWNEPGIPFQAMKWLLADDGALVIRPRLDPAMWRWLLRFAWASRESAYLASARATLPLARHSLRLMQELRGEHDVAYDATHQGILTLIRHPVPLGSLRAGVETLGRLGVEANILGRDEVLDLEPALEPLRQQLVGALHTPEDESGDVHAFATALASLSRSNGVSFEFDTEVSGFRHHGTRITGVTTTRGVIEADAFVLALGAESGRLLRPLGIRLPVYPIKGHSITVVSEGGAGLPTRPIRDRVHKVAVTPMGDRLRVAGMAVLDGGQMTADPGHLSLLRRAMRELFPALPDDLPETVWTGLRPMTPDGPPILGPAKFANLFLNVGQGPLGWTLACGSGSVIADLVSGRGPDIDLGGLTLSRYGG